MEAVVEKKWLAGSDRLRETAGHFTQAINGYQLFWVFFLASFLGAMTETVFMLLTKGELQNRSGVIYGQFSLVWGLGAVLFTLCLRGLAGRSALWIFLSGTLLGGGYEYLCSWVQEWLFGACFWDYSHIPLNINGRVSLLYASLWGVAALLWVRGMYPALCRLMALLPNRWGRQLTVVLALFMVCNVALSGAALGRWNERQLHLAPDNQAEEFLDRHFPDQRMYENYSTLTFIGTKQAN